MLEELLELKKYHKEKMALYEKQIEDFIYKYGRSDCYYLSYRRECCTYHQGAWNALNELERKIK